MRTFAPKLDLRSLQLLALALERPLSLNVPAVLEDLRRALDATGSTPALIGIDTLSKYAPGLKENVTEEMTAFLSALGRSLRDHYGSTVVLVAHAGHGDPKRPRGSSTLMCNPDAEYITECADAASLAPVTVSRARFKDSPALGPLAYAAEVVDLGRIDRYGKPVTSLVLKATDAPVSAVAKPELRGKAQRQLLAALRANANGVGIFTLGEMREIGRKAGLHRNTARAAVEALTFTSYLTASVGGWKLTDA
jgi:hypothetical protein